MIANYAGGLHLSIHFYVIITVQYYQKFVLEMRFLDFNDFYQQG